jgi:hypothetical protein
VEVVRLIPEERACSSGDESKRSECSHDQDREVSRDAEGDPHLCICFQAELFLSYSGILKTRTCVDAKQVPVS